MLTFNEMVIETLKNHPEKRMTAREIGAIIYDNYPDYVERRKSSRKKVLVNREEMTRSLGRDVYTDTERIIKKSDYKVKVIDESPRKWYYTENTDEEEVHQTEVERVGDVTNPTNPKRDLAEKELYPILAEYLESSNLSDGSFYVKRIDEKRSDNKYGSGGNKWLFPDVVAVEELSNHWEDEVKELAKHGNGAKTKLWSFEVKKLINRSNVRETYFQAVSNSGWANFGYLVAQELSGESTLRELRMLASLHGIGFIRLDHETPQESEILIPATEKTNLNWEMLNRLASENRDFLDFCERNSQILSNRRFEKIRLGYSERKRIVKDSRLIIIAENHQ